MFEVRFKSFYIFLVNRKFMFDLLVFEFIGTRNRLLIQLV
jgi:hypothetical protein